MSAGIFLVFCMLITRIMMWPVNQTRQVAAIVYGIVFSTYKYLLKVTKGH